MAYPRAQTWLTYATRPQHVSLALVLANSLRRTRTIHRIGCVVSSNLSPQDRSTLRQNFDDIFFLNKDDEISMPKNGSDYFEEESQAKIFAFTLEFFEKVVFLEPNSMLLENSDHLFTSAKGNIVPLMLDEGNGVPIDYFLITPYKPFAQFLSEAFGRLNGARKNAFKDFLLSHTKKWVEKIEYGDLEEIFNEEDTQLGNSVVQLSLKTGELLKKDSWAPPSIVQLTEGHLELPQMIKQVEILLSQDKLALTERAILTVWKRLVSEEMKIGYPIARENGNEPIAIVGLSCRLPGANNLEEFWNMLYAGEDASRPPPQFRWKKEHVVTELGEKGRTVHAGFLVGTIDEFDAKFFGVSPKEAVFMDPQTRLLHEVMWESLESSGVDPSSLYGSHTGIYTGSWLNDYKDIVQNSSSRDFFRTYMGNSIGAGAARLSFLLGLTGPCIATESGCSSAIVAVDMAVKSLRCGETNLALAGGVNLLLHPFTSKIMDYVIAPDGKCKTFDAKADGFGRAEGAGFLVLKRLSDALKDRDNIWGLIRGSAVSQEGISRSLGTPTIHCEALAMKLALKNGGVKPEQVTFVETHGTGTAVGDPMEIAAIAQAYNSKRRKEPLIIGSVKTNVGHTESCSGITGIIKAVLSMYHEVIPKHLNLETLNSNINLELIPGKIPVEAIPWPKVPGKPRLAGVSSFGITGTDGHVIIQEAPDITLPKFTVGLERPLHILKISGKTKEVLDDLLVLYSETFQKEIKEDFLNVAYTANIGRAGFDQRAFIVASDYENAIDCINQGNNLVKGEVMEQVGKLCFLFTGQGSQYPGMSKSLYESSPVFQFHFDSCDKILKEEYNVDIKKVLWESEKGSKELSRTIFSQTSIFVVEYCLLKLWQSWGLKPDFALGHSLGEFCAAVASGILSFEDALKLVTERSRLIDNLPRGNMLVLKGSKQEVEEIMKGARVTLDFAAVNSSEQTVVAGDTEMVTTLHEYCKEKGLKTIILEATHAFHSKHMDAMLDEYRKIAQGINYGKADGPCKYISGMEGKLIENVDAEYWTRHTREPVNFLGACQTLKENDVGFYLEVGPQPVLSTFVLQNLEGQNVQCLPSLRRGTNEWERILTSLGMLWVAGYQIDWQEFDKPYDRKKVDVLPFYPFQRKSFWVDVNEQAPPNIHPLVGSQLTNASNLSIYQNDLNVGDLPYLKDHCIGSRIVFPGAGFTEICLAAGYVVSNFIKDGLDKPRQPLALENVRIETPLELKEGKPTRLQVIVDLPEKLDENEKERHAFRCKVFHRNLNETEMGTVEKWVGHATAEFYPIVGQANELLLRQWNPERIKEIMGKCEPISMEPFYKRIDGVGLKFGETFRSIQRNWNEVQEEFGLDEVVAEVKVPEDVDKYLLHPLIIDAMFQAQIVAGVRSGKTEVLRVPVKVGRLVLFNTLVGTGQDEKVYIHAKWIEKEKCQVWVCREDLVPLALMEEVELLETNVKTIQSVLEIQNSQIPECWEEVWKPIPGILDNRLVLGNNLETVTTEPDFLKKIKQVQKIYEDDSEHSKMVQRLVTLYAFRALLQLGWKPKAGQETSARGLCLRLGIKTGYMEQLIYHYFTTFLSEFTMLVKNSTGDSWTVANVPYSGLEQTQEQIQILQDKLLKSDRMRPIAQIYENIGKYLPRVLTGEENPLAILFPLEPEKQHLSADCYYRVHPGRQDMIDKAMVLLQNIVQSWIDNQTTEKRVCRILEVGAGTGSLTQEVLSQFRSYFGTQFEYYYTDISASFFSKADKRFEDFKQNLKFAVFNIEENPLVQGIPVNYFDMVLATDVLHATRNLKECLANLRMIMRPKGQFIFTETIIPDKGITSVFGILEGYWRFEDLDVRPYHSCVGGRVWKKLLLENGFDYVFMEQAYFGTLGVIAATASELSGYSQWKELEGRGKEIEKRNRWILFVPVGDTGRSLKEIGETLNKAGCNVELVYWKQEMENEENQDIYKILGENRDMETIGVIYGWGLENGVQRQERVALPFMHLAKWLLEEKKPPRLYVLTRNVHGITEELNYPAPATLFGMAKSLKNENSDLFVRIVDLSKGDLEREVDQLLYELAMCKQTKEKERVQVCYRNSGQRYEPRLTRVQIEPKSKSELQLPPSTDRYQLKLPSSRIISDLEYIPMEAEIVKENEIELRVHAYALNFRDIFAILKPSQAFENINTVGLDYAGVITRLGPGETKWKVGDRVFGANFKDYQLPSHLVSNRSMFMQIPDGLNFAEASTIPAVFSTSIHCLLNVAKMTKEDTVLIHTGSGGVGLSAIQLAKYVGAKIITTAGSPRKRAYLRNLGIEHVFHSRDTSYHENIMRVTNGQGVDIVLNSITGPGMKEASLASCAQNARFVEMSKLAVWSEEEVKARRPDVHYWVVDLTVFAEDVWQSMNKKMGELMSQGHVSTIPFVKFDGLRIRQALQYFQKAKHIGKVVVTMPEVRAEQGQWKVKTNLFDSDSSYLITGGLGGIGFEVCKWMLENGAGDLVLTGRSPPKKDIQAQIDTLNKRSDVKISVILGDVGHATQCKQIIEQIKNSGKFKVLRGIHHCAGVLKDNLYANQSWATFQETFNPKVDGTWNLHNFTRDLPLEQFVLYSSLTALVGTPGQANHAAANCFEDCFAHYRYSLGLPATTINWGQWAQVGCAKDVNLSGVLPVSVHRMLNGLEETLRSQRVQVCYSEFESIAAWTLLVPAFKYYLDEKLLRSLNTQGDGNGAQCTLQSVRFWEEMDAQEDIVGKMDVATNYMKAVLRNALRMEADEPIKEDANIQDLGVDSLMLIELRNSIQSLLGNRLNVTGNMLKDCSTIRQLAKVIVDKIMDQDGGLEDGKGVDAKELSEEEAEKLLEEDCKLEEEIRPKIGRSEIQAGKIETLLVTGVTGQLGPYMLARLNKVKSLKKILCLVRCREGVRPEEKLVGVLRGMGLTEQVDMSKVECLKGDVVKDKFGLEPGIWNKLSLEVDCVIHLAAKSNHVAPYRKLEGGNDVRSVNVGGTKNVIRFAIEGKTKSILYASSILAAFGEGEQENSLSDSWPENDDWKRFGPATNYGYSTSKFVSEVLLRQAQERGIPVKIFRLPWIMGESTTGRLNFQNNHYILRFITYLKLKAMLMAPLPAILLPVDICADWTVRLFWDDKAPCGVYNVMHPKPQCELEFVQVAKEEFGVELELVDSDSKDFMEKMYATDMPLEAMKDLYEDMDKIVELVMSNRFSVSKGYFLYADKYFRNEKLAKYLPDMEKGLGSTMDMLRNDLKFVRSTGFLSKFGL